MKNMSKRSIFHGKCYFGKHKIVWKALSKNEEKQKKTKKSAHFFTMAHRGHAPLCFVLFFFLSLIA